jgi:hypothetical protein
MFYSLVYFMRCTQVFDSGAAGRFLLHFQAAYFFFIASSLFCTPRVVGQERWELEDVVYYRRFG